MVLRITRILFPVDFSDRCSVIAGRVKALAEHLVFANSRTQDFAEGYPADVIVQQFNMLRRSCIASDCDRGRRFRAKVSGSCRCSEVD
jgi:hypothetical protein